MEEFQMQPFRLRPTPRKLLSLLMLPLQTRGLARTDTINVVTKKIQELIGDKTVYRQ